MSPVLEVLGALAPSVGVGLVFWYAMRAIIRADRNERQAIARMERVERETATHSQMPT